MGSVSSKTSKEDTEANSVYVMLELSTEMISNKDSNTHNPVVKHNKLKLQVKLSAHNATISNIVNDYTESFLTLTTLVGKTHNRSIVFNGKKTKKILKKL